MSNSNKSISQLDELSSVSEDDLMIVSHLSGSSYVSRSVSVAGLSSVLATKDDFDGIEEALQIINAGALTPADVMGVPKVEWIDDGYTYVHIDLTRMPSYVQNRRTFKFNIGATSIGCLTVDWGDGTSSTNLSGGTTYSVAETMQHTYVLDAGNKFSLKFTTSQSISFQYTTAGLFLHPESNVIYAIELGALTQLFGYLGGGGLTLGRADISLPVYQPIRLLIGTNRVSNGFYGNGIASLEIRDGVTFKYTSTDFSPVTCLGMYINSLDYKIQPPEGVQWTTLAGMFANSKALFKLDISYIDTSKVQSTYTMFDQCIALNQLKFGDCDWSSCVQMNFMFRGCSSLRELDVSDWNTSAVTTMQNMFDSCTNLETLDVSQWNTSQITTFASMFANCNRIRELDVSQWNMSACTNVGNMFGQDNALIELDLTEWDLSHVTNANNMFINCYALSSLIGGKTVASDGSIDGSTAYFGKGPHASIGHMVNDTLLDHDSLLFLIYWVPDMTGSAAQTIQMGATLKAKLTAEEIAIATAKNWNIT